MLALQEVDADPGNCSCPGHVDQIKLPDGAQPFWIALDRTNTHAYVSDRQDYGGKGRIYVIDIDPSSPDFHRADKIRTIEVDGAGEGLRQLVVSDDGKRLYVAAPNRDEVSVSAATRATRGHSLLVVVNIDPLDAPTSPDKNPFRYEQQIARFDTGQETYAVQTTGDPTRVLITNRHLDGDGVQALTVTNNTSQAFSGTIDQVTELTLGSLFDTFDVNDGEGLLVLPKDALEGRRCRTARPLGPHPEYIFVAGFDRFILGDPSHDPDEYPQETDTFEPMPGGSNVGIIRDGKLVAATYPIPDGWADNIAFASGHNYLFASFQGVETAAGSGAVFVFNLVNLIWEVEHDLQTPEGTLNLQRYPVDRLGNGHVLPLQEDLLGDNTGIDIRADYRILSYNDDAARILFGVPAVMDGAGHYVDGGRRRILDYKRDRKGDFVHPDGTPVGPGRAAADAVAERARSASAATRAASART